VLTTSIASGDADDFDATQIAPLSVRLGPLNAADVDGEAVIADHDNDGDIDATFDFLTGDAGFGCTATSGTLVGETYAGDPVSGAGALIADCEAGCH
jgi:hypothetical protein